MRRTLFVFLLTLSACTPVFEQAEGKQLNITYQGDRLTLTSDAPVQRGSVGIRAESVTSHLCAVEGCLPDAGGVVLLRLIEGPEYGRTVILGHATGLVRVKAAIVRKDEGFAVVRDFEF